MGKHVYTEDGTRLAHIWYTDEGSYVEGDVEDKSEIIRMMGHTLHEQNMLKANQYDFLTGLPSMTYFFELAEASKVAILNEGDHPMILYFDFNGMKFFNNKHGFAEGDRMLRHFGVILRRNFGVDSCCRIGGDHFAVTTSECGLEEKLRIIFREWEEFCNGRRLPVHVGIYRSRGDKIHVSIALDRAKLACNALRDNYASCFMYYSQDLSDDMSHRQYIIENLDRAIEENWIQVYFQPIIRAVNERVSDVEALARWIDPEKGLLSPDRFIPALEDAGLIYKLDLHVLDQVLLSIKRHMAAGASIIPHSINLSRADFEHCDMVEEFRKRVDAAGVPRDRITVEVTESIVGSNYAFMKEQIERFRNLGFPVWMDDFGSGYSSLDVLQSIPFDLIKFDMSFMRKLDDGESGKVVLTELMRMATSLGVDTVCEGVEKESQIQFLQEIGCSKLQGYYYCRPIPFEMIREMHKNNTLIEDENPNESDYYETIGRVNLFDLGVIASGDEDILQNTFSTIPMAILEVRDGKAEYIRSNRSYQEFHKRYIGIDITMGDPSFDNGSIHNDSTFLSVLRQCCTNGNRAFFDEKLPDGSVIHSFARRIATNPVTGGIAVAIAVLSIREPDDNANYADIAKALAADYYNIYVIDLDTDHYIEYSSKIGGEELYVERHGEDFFESARSDTMTRIYEEDREPFLKWFSKENVIKELDSQGVFTSTYRLIDSGKPVYVNMKITRMQGGNRIILGVSVIDAQMKQKKHYEELQKEREMLVRVMALSDGYLSLFTVDPKTGEYVEYSSSEDFDSLGAEKFGDDFFGQAYVDAFTYCYPPDRDRFQEQVTMENVMNEIRMNGSFSIDYHLIIKGDPRPVTLKAALFKDKDEEKLVVGVRAWKQRKK